MIKTHKVKKFIYGTYCSIRGSIIESAIRTKSTLRIVVPDGRFVLMDPNDWKKTCKMGKTVHNFKDNPMILYYNYVPLPGINVEIITPEKKKKEELQLTLF